jgi:hypothetical protein
MINIDIPDIEYKNISFEVKTTDSFLNSPNKIIFSIPITLFIKYISIGIKIFSYLTYNMQFTIPSKNSPII